MAESPSRQDGSVLVRVSPYILERMKNGDVEPVVILGIQEEGDGTYVMTLMTTDLIYENRKLREGLQQIVDGDPDHADALRIASATLGDANEVRNAAT